MPSGLTDSLSRRHKQNDYGKKTNQFRLGDKKILRSKANFGVLEGFLSELLFTEIRILEVLESESNQEHETNKSNRVNIKVVDNHQKIILIEIQYSRELDYLQRILFASAKTIAEHLPKGEAYSEISKVISINILYFDFGKGDDYIYHGTTRFIGLHNHSELQLSEEQKRLYRAEKIAEIYLEYYLIEIRNFNDIAKDTLDEWIYFLKNETIEEHFTAKGLQQAQEVLDVLKMDAEERRAYESHQKQLHHEASLYESTYVLGHLKGKEEGINEGMEIGIKKGSEETMLTVAKNMKQAGMDANMITHLTGLTTEHIASL